MVDRVDMDLDELDTHSYYCKVMRGLGGWLSSVSECDFEGPQA